MKSTLCYDAQNRNGKINKIKKWRRKKAVAVVNIWGGIFVFIKSLLVFGASFLIWLCLFRSRRLKLNKAEVVRI